MLDYYISRLLMNDGKIIGMDLDHPEAKRIETCTLNRVRGLLKQGKSIQGLKLTNGEIDFSEVNINDVRKVEFNRLSDLEVTNENGSYSLINALLDEYEKPFILKLTKPMLIGGVEVLIIDDDSYKNRFKDKRDSYVHKNGYAMDFFERNGATMVENDSIKITSDYFREGKEGQPIFGKKKKRKCIELPVGTELTVNGFIGDLDYYRALFEDWIKDEKLSEKDIAKLAWEWKSTDEAEWEMTRFVFITKYKINNIEHYIKIQRTLTDLLIPSGLYTENCCAPFTAVINEPDFDKLRILGMI